jgi:hypothetical protein
MTNVFKVVLKPTKEVSPAGPRSLKPPSARLRDGNGYPEPDYPTGFTRYEDGYEMIYLPAGMLMGNNLYPLGRWVRVRVGTTHTVGVSRPGGPWADE